VISQPANEWQAWWLFLTLRQQHIQSHPEAQKQQQQGLQGAKKNGAPGEIRTCP